MPDPTEAQGADIAALRAEVDHWKHHAEEAGQGFAQVCRDYARVSARNVALVERLERIEALADEWEGWARTRSTTRIDAFRDAAESLRAVLGEYRIPPASTKEADRG